MLKQNTRDVETSAIGSSNKPGNFKLGLASLLHADVNSNKEKLVESTKIVPTYKEERKSKVEENKAIEKYAAQNHTHEKKGGGRDIGMHSRESLVEKTFAN